MKIKVSKDRGVSKWWVEAIEDNGSPIFNALRCVYQNPINDCFYVDHQKFDDLKQATRYAKLRVVALVNGDI